MLFTVQRDIKRLSFSLNYSERETERAQGHYAMDEETEVGYRRWKVYLGNERKTSRSEGLQATREEPTRDGTSGLGRLSTPFFVV